MAGSLRRKMRLNVPEALVRATRPLRLYFHPQRRFDRRWGVETSACVEARDLDAHEEARRHASGYEPTPRAEFFRMLRGVREALDRYVFVDLGSGKGAVLLYALERPFRRIIGVELSPALHGIARRNLDRVRRLRPRLTARHVELHCMDVTDYQLPLEPAICFLGNPFKGKTLDAVVSNVRRSLEILPRDLLILYFHPLSRHAAWDGAPFLDTVARAPRHTLYRSRPAW
jgi:SAM-dependent methyltransferase